MFEVEKINIMNAKFNEIINGNDLVLVDFYAEWCGPCKMMSPILQEVKINLKESVKIIKINVDQHEDLASHFMVRGVPTLMLFKTGKMLWRQSGVLSSKDLTDIISNHLN
ncbi:MULTISPECIES: thioredoxin [unclassified Flavobacterium]